MTKHPLSDCTNCPLRNEQFYLQPARSEAKYLFIGGGPVGQEGFKGGFYNTSAGRLIKNVCNFHNIANTDTTYITAVGCSGLSDLSAKDKNLAIKACNGLLFEQIEQINPEAIIPLGNDALTATTGKRGVATHRIGPATYSDVTETILVPTVSPWACLAQESQFMFLVTDIGKLVNPAPEFQDPEYNVVTIEKEAEDLLHKWLYEAYVTERNPLVLDIEVAMEKDINFEHPDRFDMLCIGVKFANNPITVFAEDALSSTFYLKLERLAEYSLVIAHNGKFDLAGLYSHTGDIRLGFDTMLASYVFDERSGIHGLKYLAQEYLGAPAYDDEIAGMVGAKKDFGAIPKPILYKYNAFDIHCTYLLWLMYETRFDKDLELKNVHNFLVEISNMLREVERTGLTIDEEYLDELETRYDFILKGMRKDLTSKAIYLVGAPTDPKLGFNPNSYQQVKRVLAAQSINVPSTNEATLTKVLEFPKQFPTNDEQIREFVSTLLSYRKEVKLSGTYVNGTKERIYNGKVHPTFLIHGTTTGRLSCRNPNVQNIPRKSPIKRMFVSSAEDRSIVNTDFKQAELRTLCYFAKDDYFRAIFNDPTRDPFDELVPELFPGSIKSGMDPDIWKEQRTMVKTYVYGLNYGRTEYGIAKGFGIEVEVAKEHMNRFFSVIPRIINWQESIKRQVHNGEDLVTPFGRHRRYSLITKENERNVMNEALAFLPQSTASDITLQAAINLSKMFAANWAPEIKPKIINLVHDAIMTDCKDSDIDEVIALTERVMISSAESVVGDYVLFGADSSSAKTWGDIA